MPWWSILLIVIILIIILCVFFKIISIYVYPSKSKKIWSLSKSDLTSIKKHFKICNDLTIKTNINRIQTLNEWQRTGYLAEKYTDWLLLHNNQNLWNLIERKIGKTIYSYRWVNEVDETRKPFDFVLYLKNQQIHIDVKAVRSNKLDYPIYISSYEQQNAQSLKSQNSAYLLIVYYGFNFMNEHEFAPLEGTNLIIRIIDLNSQEDLKNINWQLRNNG